MPTKTRAAPNGIAMFDTSIGTDNLGDYIIMDAVWDAYREIFGSLAPAARIPTHSYMQPGAYESLSGCRLGIVGGTNILKSHMFVRANWRLRLRDMLVLKNIVLLGVGWQQYQGRIDFLSKALFRRAFSSEFMHSVRDEYTAEKLSGAVRNVVYTACPTLWSLTPQKCAEVPTSRADSVILSLTYYRPDPVDAELLRLLKREYANVHIWCQQPRDVEYVNSLGVAGPGELVIDIEAYNELLRKAPVDVIGTRLHGGIRALQYGRRALILAIDNRATEMARSTQIPVVDRHDLESMRAWVATSAPVSIELPWSDIAAWKGQFKSAG